MPGELRAIREEVERNAEKAGKARKEIEMMADAAKNGWWIEVNQGEVCASDITEAKDGLTDESREIMNEQIIQIRKEFNRAVEKLGDGEGELETDTDNGHSKGLERGYVERLEQKISDLESVL